MDHRAHDLSGSVSVSPSLLSINVVSQTYILGGVSRIWDVVGPRGLRQMMMDNIGDFKGAVQWLAGCYSMVIYFLRC